MNGSEHAPLSREELVAAAEAAGIKLYIFDCVDSTSDECRRRAAGGERNFAIIAEEQSRGRGRSGKSFFSPAGTGLYMSVVLDTGGSQLDPAGITTRAAVCTAQAIREVCGVKCGIKWVNDLFLDGKKVCGILAELFSPELVILGVGINLEESSLPAELEGIVGFLRCGDKKYSLAAELLRRLCVYKPGDRSHMEAYRNLSIVTGKTVSFSRGGKRIQALALDIDDEGSLIVKTEDEIISLSSGEISLSSW